MYIYIYIYRYRYLYIYIYIYKYLFIDSLIPNSIGIDSGQGSVLGPKIDHLTCPLVTSI